jgi:ABC-type transporter MlaC component
VIEGVSLVSNYRNTYGAIVKSEGMDGLLDRLEQSIKQYRATPGPDKAP